MDNYVSSTPGSNSIDSGSWQKWSRNIGGAWSGATTAGSRNYFGRGCAGDDYDWCSEWGIGGKYLGIMPDYGSGETYAQGFSSGQNWTLTIQVGASRDVTCGF